MLIQIHVSFSNICTGGDVIEDKTVEETNREQPMGNETLTPSMNSEEKLCEVGGNGKCVLHNCAFLPFLNIVLPFWR